MKRLIISLIIMAGFAMQALAYDFQSGNLLYSIISTKPYCVSLDGHIDGQEAVGELIIPEAVEYNNVVYAVTEIGPRAFFRCFHLTGDLVIPQSVLRIGSRAFSSCGFDGTLTLPNSLVEIGRNAFDAKVLTGQLVLPNSIEQIEPSAFARSNAFTGDLVIPESVTMIGDSAFWFGSFDGNLIIGGNVERIGDMAFYQCSALTGDLLIPESVESIGRFAFYKCEGFDGRLSLPSQLSEIEDAAFAWCRGLTGNLGLPENVTRIGWQAFTNCSFTGEVVIPNAVVRIESEAFANCPQITSLTIGSAVERIDNLAFAFSNPLLESIKLHAETPPSLHYSTFNNVPRDIPVYIPCNTLELYQNAAYWDEFTNLIEDCSLSADDLCTNSVSVSCYPNPANDLVRIEGLEPAEIQVYNTLGQLLNVNHNTSEIRVRDLPKGIYLLRITDVNGSSSTSRIIVAR